MESRFTDRRKRMQQETVPAQVVFSTLYLPEAPVPVRNTSLASVDLTLNERLQVAGPVPTVAAEQEWHHRIIYEYPNTRLRLVVFLATLQPFDDHPTGKWGQLRYIPGSLLVWPHGVHHTS